MPHISRVSFTVSRSAATVSSVRGSSPGHLGHRSRQPRRLDERFDPEHRGRAAMEDHPVVDTIGGEEFPPTLFTHAPHTTGSAAHGWHLFAMKIAVMGASGLIGSKVVDLLGPMGTTSSRPRDPPVSTSSPEPGLADALAGADALVDVLNSPSFEADAVMAFFTGSATNLVEAARRAGVGHYVALSIVGVDGLPDSPYMRAKVAQERIITASGLPFSIVRATQFAEFTDAIVESLTVGDEVRVPDALIQPIPADDVAATVARAARSRSTGSWTSAERTKSASSRWRVTSWRGGATPRPGGRGSGGALLRCRADAAQPGDH